jgi:hypothetical protein
MFQAGENSAPTSQPLQNAVGASSPGNTDADNLVGFDFTCAGSFRTGSDPEAQTQSADNVGKMAFSHAADFLR